MSQDRNPYYDSSRHKVDKSEFASLRMDLPPARQRSSGGGTVLKIVAWVVALVLIAVVAKRFLFA